jgi:hypothetical protein
MSDHDTNDIDRERYVTLIDLTPDGGGRTRGWFVSERQYAIIGRFLNVTLGDPCEDMLTSSEGVAELTEVAVRHVVMASDITGE